VVPDQPIIEKWAAENGVTGTYAEILANSKTNKFYLDEMKAKCKEASVSNTLDYLIIYSSLASRFLPRYSYRRQSSQLRTIC
jgi:gamma-glutamyl phosphate reductase